MSTTTHNRNDTVNRDERWEKIDLNASALAAVARKVA